MEADLDAGAGAGVDLGRAADLGEAAVDRAGDAGAGGAGRRVEALAVVLDRAEDLVVDVDEHGGPGGAGRACGRWSAPRRPRRPAPRPPRRPPAGGRRRRTAPRRGCRRAARCGPRVLRRAAPSSSTAGRSPARKARSSSSCSRASATSSWSVERRWTTARVWSTPSWSVRATSSRARARATTVSARRTRSMAGTGRAAGDGEQHAARHEREELGVLLVVGELHARPPARSRAPRPTTAPATGPPTSAGHQDAGDGPGRPDALAVAARRRRSRRAGAWPPPTHSSPTTAAGWNTQGRRRIDASVVAR